MVLAALLAVWIDLSPIHRFHNSDSLIPVLMSLDRWTPFYWEQNRFGMLVPLLALPFRDPFANLLVQEVETVVPLLYDVLQRCLRDPRRVVGGQEIFLRTADTVTTEVPHDDGLGFVILEKDGYEIMLQTTASMKADVPATVPPPGGSVLYLEVADLSAIERAVAGHELLVPRRKTFYGAEEIFVREPGGNEIGFAQFGGSGAES